MTPSSLSEQQNVSSPWSIAKHLGTDPVVSLFQDLLKDYPKDFALRFWDGAMWPAEPGQNPRFTLILKHPGSLRKLFSAPLDVSLGEAYIHDDLDVEGDFEAALDMVDFLVSQSRGLRFVRAFPGSQPDSGKAAIHLMGAKHSEQRDRQAVTYHYNVSNDFFALWLDPRMLYSSAYFESPVEDLAQAQLNKLDRLCRQLRLRPGERLLDVGCGWGGLLIYAALKYRVEGVGITLSEPQANLARERIGQAGLSARCEVRVEDYRQLDRSQPYDKAISVGMFEHVGESMLPKYFDLMFKLVRPGGIFLNQGIARTRFGQAGSRSEFLDRYVFPDSEVVPLDITLKHAEQAGFEVRHVESWRKHYARTLQCWSRNLERNYSSARKIVDEMTYRIWKLYMAACARVFESSDYTTYQTVLVRTGKSERSSSDLMRHRTAEEIDSQPAFHSVGAGGYLT